MGNLLIRKHVRESLKEFFQNQVVYANDPTKFPYLDGSDETTPSDLDAETDVEFGEPSDNLKETEENKIKKD